MEYLYGRSNGGDFDYFVLAGASLGFNESKEAYSTKEVPKHASNNWHLTYEDHVKLAIDLHHITEIVVVDHMDCGYYKSIYEDAVDTPAKERAKHVFNLHKFVSYMKNTPEFSNLSYVTILANLEGEKVTFVEVDH